MKKTTFTFRVPITVIITGISLLSPSYIKLLLFAISLFLFLIINQAHGLLEKHTGTLVGTNKLHALNI